MFVNCANQSLGMARLGIVHVQTNALLFSEGKGHKSSDSHLWYVDLKSEVGCAAGSVDCHICHRGAAKSRPLW